MSSSTSYHQTQMISFLQYLPPEAEVVVLRLRPNTLLVSLL